MGLVAGKSNNIKRVTIASGGAVSVYADRDFGGTPGNPEETRARIKTERIRLVFNIPANPPERENIYTESST